MRDRQIKEIKVHGRGSFFLHLAVGAVIGIGGVLPGVSGGVMAVSLGLYRPMIEAVGGFFKSPKRNFLYLLPIGIGAALGFFLGTVVLSGVMERWYDQVLWLFLGLVAGGVPALIKEANEQGFKWRYLLATAAGAGAASVLLLLDRSGGGLKEILELGPVEALLSGGIVAVGTVFPGVSTAFVLMYLGWYRAMMRAFARIELAPIILVSLGFLGVAALTIKAARWLFDRFHGYAYYGVLGFLLVSAGLIFPGFTSGIGQAVSIALAAAGAAAAYALGKISI